jgi:hypothetical protein
MILEDVDEWRTTVGISRTVLTPKRACGPVRQGCLQEVSHRSTLANVLGNEVVRTEEIVS